MDNMFTHGNEGSDEVKLRIRAREVVNLRHKTLLWESGSNQKVSKLILCLPEKKRIIIEGGK
jgi:hypothetical protein